MKVCKKVNLGEHIMGMLRRFIVRLLESEFAMGMQYEMENEHERVTDDKLTYRHYFRQHDLSQDEYNELAGYIVARFLRHLDEVDVGSMMCAEALVDEELSYHWLSPIAEAERTSVAYERGRRLAERCNRIDLARSLMQKAAEEGDDDCAYYLIRNNVIREAISGADVLAEQGKVGNLSGEKSQEYRRGMFKAGSLQYKVAQEILQKAADNGDEDCAMMLVKNALLWGRKQKFPGS